VARIAGVSVSVVSRVLSDDPALRARPETRRRVRRAALDVGYTPSHAARSLRLARAFAVGLVVPDLTSPLYDLLIRGIEDVADTLGYTVLIGRTERIRPGTDYLRTLTGQGRVDGFLLQRRDDTDVHLFDRLVATGAPAVLVNARGPTRGSVTLDDATAARVATEHLLQLGHRDIGFIGGSVQSYTSKERERGFLAAIRGVGLRRRRAWIVHARYDPIAGREAVRKISSAGARRPTAIVVANLMAGIGALVGARDVGLTVPEQLSIVALHDAWMAEYTWPSLTTVRMPQYELGQAAMRLLHDRLSGGRPRDVTIIEPAPILLKRGSTAAPPRRVTRGRHGGGSRAASAVPDADGLLPPGPLPDRGRDVG
jgi:LacI family transcriptional regulator